MLPVSEPWISDRELELVTDAVKRGWISPRGEYVDRFESLLAEFVGVDHALATTTGTAALHLSLVAADIGPGDEVIVPDMTWIACANVVRYVGATPIFADVTEDSFTLDPDSVRDNVTPDTAALMPVHLYGHPADMKPLLGIAQSHDLFILEDAAEAHGAIYDGDAVGSIGDAGCFSFYGNKILTMGQGGAITTDDDDLADRIRTYRRDGMSTEQKYYHPSVGYNYRLTNIQAAVGVGQLERSEEILDAKRRVADRYRENLTGTDLRVQAEHPKATSSNWMIATVFETREDRQRVRSALAERDIETRPFFHPLHDQPPYRADSTVCPTSKTLAERGLVLPSGPRLNRDEIDQVCKIVGQTN
ncbi:DegT/DnrJ/EryC1/StrS aminotransferase family protein [Halorubrum sp. SD626R]|uniref:DegT/DnrJ/EryC1/StrS family aminotransferase n=1 Tax=Halorubrum sp. SD626R TaxID=1419722 RepID=UPI000A8B50D9|nr:DegT/DnrJ/EryC1/StrS family aminotransferase [Halorubrum sp. SD626R]TKX82270.1 DegT/DnrJ/EryC1/StrS family aminotransferase [Halorubrum sp. SD626R]